MFRYILFSVRFKTDTVGEGARCLLRALLQAPVDATTNTTSIGGPATQEPIS